MGRCAVLHPNTSKLLVVGPQSNCPFSRGNSCSSSSINTGVMTVAACAGCTEPRCVHIKSGSLS